MERKVRINRGIRFLVNNKNKRRLKYTNLLIVTLLALAGASCKSPITEVDPAFAQYIESYTSGTISRHSPIRIVLAPGDLPVQEEGATLPASLFRFEPEIKGSALMAGPRTIEFRPSEDLEPGRMYRAVFDLSEVREVPPDFRRFEFGFQVIAPSFETMDGGLRIPAGTSPEYIQYKGSVLTADVESPEQVEKLLSATYNGKKKTVTWQHFPDKKEYLFSIDSMLRGDEENDLLLQWDGAALGNEQEDEKKIAVPAKDVFKVLDIRAVNDPGQYVLLQFSQPLSGAQQLEGLITISGLSDLRYTVEGSEVKVYAPDVYEGDYQVSINEGVRSNLDKRLDKNFSASVNFENRMPSVTMHGRGVILPQTGRLTVPFEAVNLNAVDVSIIKIYESNIPQFLQQNDLQGSYGLRRVARPVVQKTIRLDDDKSVNLHRRNRFSLDVDRLIKTEPGAIYTITIGFRRAYSLYACQGAAGGETEQAPGYETGLDEDDAFWSRYDRYYPYGFEWEQRDNPCHDSYYNKQRWATRNVIASNIGLIAKREAGNSMLVTATDILTAEPMEGVTLELLDYQQQVLLSGRTDREGMARFVEGRKPFLLIARKGGQRGYLKLDDGGSLPLSRFDVGGGQVQKGLKGYIYGERGVWRPGDSLFLTFILEDKTDRLPAEHPVVFEVYNPRGQLYLRTVKNQSENGFYTFPFATGQDAPTGNWTARVKVGGAEFTKLLKIETIMPNRLKLDLDFGDRQALSKGDGEAAELSARWLFGGTARNLKATVDAFLSRRTTSFGRFDGYTFDDPATTFSSELKRVFDGRLDESGDTRFQPQIETGSGAPGMLTANFLVKVFEPGGNFSIDRVSMPYHAYTSYVGLKVPEGEGFSSFLVTGEDHGVDIVNVDTKGKLLSGNRKVQVELYKIRWRWWWDESSDDVSNFTQDSYNKLLQTEMLTLHNGKGRWRLRVEYPEWGRYFIRVKDLESGHISGQTVYIDWPGWNQRLRDEYPAEAAMLSFTANKEAFRVGEEVVLTIPSSEGGRCLVSIESGSRVIQAFWADTEPGQTTVRFEATADMAPNVYVNVSLLQPHSQTLNDLPIRMYGVIPVMVEAPETILNPEIAMAASIEPEQPASVTVSEASGKPMTYTVAIVDEGLLDLTRFKTPNPHAAFYAREALGVMSWDLFDDVVGAWGGDLERILGIGGDQELDLNAGSARANRFKPVVKFMGPFRLEAGKKKTHQFQLDPYIGSVRVMVVAGNQDAYGKEEKAVAVKKPLMLLATLPRVLAPGEKVRMPVTVFSTAPGARNVQLQVSSNDLLKPATAEAASRTVRFTAPGEQLAYVDMEAGTTTGIARVKITASSGGETAAYEVELDVRNPNPFITSVIEKEVSPGDRIEANFLPVGTPGNREGYLEVSSIPAINLSRRLGYLIRYPHGCVEQITSSVFPQLVLEQLTSLSEQEKTAIARNIRAGLDRLKGYQVSGGGLGYWPGSRDADEWGTSYAGHFMLEARERGYSPPAGFLEQWISYQRKTAITWSPAASNFRGGDLLQAYRLYLLAMAEAPEMGAMNRLREFKYLHHTAKWLLAAAYQLAGQPEAATSLVRGVPLTPEQDYEQPGRTYGSTLRDKAMILHSLVTMGRREEARELLGEVARRLSEDSWYSTQTTAFSLIAIAEYCGRNASGSRLSGTYSLNGAKAELNSSSYLARIPLELTDGQQTASLTNQGENRLFVRWILTGQPAPGDQPPPAAASGLEMTVRYKTLEGTVLDPADLAQGSDFMAEVTLRNPGGKGDYKELALSQVFPSGWEIINTRLSGEDNVLMSSPFTWQDIRDDRVYTYFDLPEKGSVTYHVLLNAAYPGTYYQPPVYCEAMYDATISARTSGRWVKVVNPAGGE